MKRVHLIEQSRFARDLAGLLRIGYPAVEAVEKLEKSRNDSLRPILERAVSKMHAGSSFSESIKDESDLLPLFVRLTSTAEGSERLPEGMERAALVLEDIAGRKTRCFLATLYPSLVFTIVCLIAWAMCVVGSGLFINLFESMNVTLPAPTRALIFMSKLGQSPIGLLLFFGPLACLWYLVLGHGKLNWYLYKIPLLGRWLLRQEAVIYLNTTGQLVAAGLPLTQATELALDCCSPPLKSRLQVVPKQLESGDKLSQALSKTGVIPELGLWAIERREQTESLRLEEIGALLDRELALNVNRGLVLFEPVIFIGVVVVISLFIGAIFVPLYQLLGNLG